MQFAYIDPATGAMLLQIVAAAVLATGVFFRRFLLSPFAFLFGKTRTDDQSESRDDSSTEENSI